LPKEKQGRKKENGAGQEHALLKRGKIGDISKGEPPGQDSQRRVMLVTRIDHVAPNVGLAEIRPKSESGQTDGHDQRGDESPSHQKCYREGTFTCGNPAPCEKDHKDSDSRSQGDPLKFRVRYGAKQKPRDEERHLAAAGRRTDDPGCSEATPKS